MENLIQDLLDYAQIKQGKFRMNLSNFRIKDTIDLVIKLFQHKAESKRIQLNADLDNLEIDYIKHDEQRIK